MRTAKTLARLLGLRHVALPFSLEVVRDTMSERARLGQTDRAGESAG